MGDFSAAMRVSPVLLSGIRDFKWAGPKPSQTRKANTRKRFKQIAGSSVLLGLLHRPELFPGSWGSVASCVIV
jgi:hypothetical protein